MKYGLLFSLGLVVGLFLGRYIWMAPSTLRSDDIAATSEVSSNDKPAPAPIVAAAQPPPATLTAAPQAAPSRLDLPPVTANDSASVEQRSAAAAPLLGRVAPKVTRRQLEGLVDKEQIDTFIQSVRQENLFDTIRSSGEFRRIEGPLADMEGRYTGEVTVPDKGETWEMTMDGRFRSDGTEVSGRTRVILSKNGKVFSRHTGNGKINNISSISGGVLVQASPTSYFQLYFLPGDHAFVGNYYEQGKPGEMLPKGVARLTRE